jgi:hypothetical protein
MVTSLQTFSRTAGTALAACMNIVRAAPGSLAGATLAMSRRAPQLPQNFMPTALGVPHDPQGTVAAVAETSIDGDTGRAGGSVGAARAASKGDAAAAGTSALLEPTASTGSEAVPDDGRAVGETRGGCHGADLVAANGGMGGNGPGGAAT